MSYELKLAFYALLSFGAVLGVGAIASSAVALVGATEAAFQHVPAD